MVRNARKTRIAPVDELLPPGKLLVFGLQHVLVMVASPIASVLIMSNALDLSPALTNNLLSATFLVCGIGSILQAFGPFGIGARLPFIALPGGAPLVLFISTAQQTDIRTTVGAVLLSGVVYFLVVPVYRRFLRFFPPVVIGTMLLLVAINLAKVGGGLIAGSSDSADFASVEHVLLAFATIGCTVIFARLLTGTLRRLAILLGLIAGTLIAIIFGAFQFDQLSMTPLLSLPKPLPFGTPKFDIIASIPLMLFSVISMLEATGQTVAISEAVDKEVDKESDAPKTIRGDGINTLLGGLLGTSLIITSSENIGVVQATGVRSRYVTAVAGLLLIAFALFAPLATLIIAVPKAIIGGTALIVFTVIATIGIDMLGRADMRNHSNIYVVAVALSIGLLPILVPGFYQNFPSGIRSLLSNGVAIGALAAVILNFLFRHLGRKRPRDLNGDAAIVNNE